jgi:hypothetical protein
MDRIQLECASVIIPTVPALALEFARNLRSVISAADMARVNQLGEFFRINYSK